MKIQSAVPVLAAVAVLTGSTANASIQTFQPIRVADPDALPVVEIGLRARGQPAIARGNYVYEGRRYNGAGQYLGPARSAKRAAGKHQ